MTQVRYEYLQNALPLPDSGEYVFGIGSNDIFTRLDVQLSATNGATNNQVCSMADVLTSFELMDGSEVITSVTGAELAGLIANRQGRMPFGLISEVPAIVQSLRFSLDFGRWYLDSDLALDLSRFKNMQCRVRWNLAAVNAVGATGFVTATTRLTVIAHVADGMANPTGYLNVKRHALFTTAASGEEPIELPLDKVIRSITIRSYEAGTGALSGISNVRLTADEGKFKPLDLAVADFLQSLVDTVAPFVYRHDFHDTNGDTAYALLKHNEAVQMTTPLIDSLAVYTTANIGEGAVIQFTPSTGAALATDQIHNAIVTGWLPFSCAYLPFGDYADPNTWLPANNFKKLLLSLTQNNAGAACSVLVEQLVSY